MRVLEVTTHLDMGGIANYVLYLSKALQARGVPCVVASSGGDLEKEMVKSGVICKRLNIRTKNEFSPRVLMAIFTLVKIIKEEKIDIIHAHTRVSQVASFFASRLTGVPYITTCHGFFKRRLRKIFDTWGDKVIAISDAVAYHLKKDLDVEEDRVALIYSGIEIDRFLKDHSEGNISEIKRSVGLKEGPVIGTIGRLSPVKGQKFIIEAMPQIISGNRNTELIIVGNGPEETKLKSLVRSLGLEESVRFAGSSPNTEKFLSIMDIFVFPSLKEGLGIALLEALAAGKACVASRIGGIEDVITDGLNGLLVPAGDPGALAKAVAKLLNDPMLRNGMGEKGRSLVRERFSLDSMAYKVISLYKEAAK